MTIRMFNAYMFYVFYSYIDVRPHLSKFVYVCVVFFILKAMHASKIRQV